MATAQNTTLKRTSADAGLPDKPVRTNKRRAQKACRCCRARKVRCNVTEYGAPCTNCRLDEVECVIAEGKRKSRKSFALPQPEQQDSTVSENGHQERVQSLSDESDITPIIPHFEGHENIDLSSHIPHSIYRNHNNVPTITDNSTASRLSSLPGANPAYSSNAFRISRTLSMLPKYIKSLPPHLGFDDHAYLSAKGALTIPNEDVVDQIIHSYVQWHHPIMPIVDVEALQKSVVSDGVTGGKISLLILQAILYAGSAHVDLIWLRRAGYADRREARKAFYSKTRLLYEMDTEADRFTHIQALLLMTSWYAPDEKDGWHWLCIAISTACSIGLHRDPSRTHLSPSQQRLCKRVWWCLVIRDRVIALGQRKPTSIKLEESDVPFLTLEDYAPFNSLSPLDTEDDLRTSAILHMEFAKLSLCVGKVLTTQYSVHPAVSSQQKRGLVPNITEQSLSRVKDCHVELEAWYHQLPVQAQIDDTQSAPSPTQRLRNIFLNRTLIHLIYYATLSALHRPQMLPNATQRAVDIDFSIHQVYSAATSITTLAKSLLDHDLVPHVPTYGSTVLLPAMTKHLVDLRGFNIHTSDTDSNQEARKTSLQGFAYCIRAMRHLQQNYTCADVSMALIEAAVQRAGIKIGVAGHEYVATCVDDLMSQACAQDLVACYQALTPPAEDETFNCCPDESDNMAMPMTMADFSSLSAHMPPSFVEHAGRGHGTHADMDGSSFFQHLHHHQTTTPPLSENGSLAYVAAEHDGMDFGGSLDNAFGLNTNVAEANIEHELQAFLNFDIAGFDLNEEFGAPAVTNDAVDAAEHEVHALEEKSAENEAEAVHVEQVEGEHEQDDAFVMHDAITMPHDFEDMFEAS